MQFANAALENTLGLSRRTLEGVDFSPSSPTRLAADRLGERQGEDFAALRYEANLKRLHQDPVPVHVNVADAEQVGEKSWWAGRWSSRPARDRERLRDQAQPTRS